MRDSTFVYLMEWFQWNLPQIFIMWVGFQGQRSRSCTRWHQMHFCSRGVHFSGVALRLVVLDFGLFNYKFLFW